MQQIGRARGSTRPIQFYLKKGDTRFDLTGAAIAVYLLRTLESPGTNYRATYSNTGVLTGSPIRGVNDAVPDADQTATGNRGLASWTPTASDLATPGYYWFQAKIVEAGGEEDSTPAVTVARLHVYDAFSEI